ncbi:MAG: hypothetical protein Q9181_006353 [Wetmoreana brouardii]
MSPNTPGERMTSKPSQIHRSSLDPTILKCINHFARRHTFLTEQSFNNYNSDDTKLDDEIDDSSTLLVRLPASTGRSPPATQPLTPLETQTQPHVCAIRGESRRKRPSDAFDDRNEKKRKADGDAGTEEQPQEARTRSQIKGKLLASFESAALQYYDKPATESLKEKVVESVRYAANQLDLEDMEDSPAFPESASKAFGSCA